MFFEVSIFVAAYCSLSTHTHTGARSLTFYWLFFQRNFRFCRLLRIEKLAQRESNRQKWAPKHIRFPVDFYCQHNSDVRRFLSFYFTCTRCVYFVTVWQYIHTLNHPTHMSLMPHSCNTKYPIKIEIARNTSGKAHFSRFLCRLELFHCHSESYKYFGSFECSTTHKKQQQEKTMSTELKI